MAYFESSGTATTPPPRSRPHAGLYPLLFAATSWRPAALSSSLPPWALADARKVSRCQQNQKKRTNLPARVRTRGVEQNHDRLFPFTLIPVLLAGLYLLPRVNAAFVGGERVALSRWLWLGDTIHMPRLSLRVLLLVQ